MRQEDIQLVIRSRTILECLDLAFLFCGRHFVGLFLTSVVGILPFAILNWYVRSLPTHEDYFFYLLLAMEAPWATVLTTLYLGQITFSRKFSTRRAGVDFLHSLPGMFVYQFLIRGICLLFCVTAPVVFIGMYYLNEILLLEKLPMGKAWTRRGAMNERALERVLSLRMFDLMTLVGSTILLSMLFRSVSSLWEDRFQWDPEMFMQDMFQFDWQLNAAYWITLVYLTVFRFMSYLDSRIRREGWDVELKLRNLAETYRQREVAE